MFNLLRITCNQATTICDKSQYGEATFIEKIKLKFHFKKCKKCGLYSEQNTFLSGIYKQYATDCKSIKHKMKNEDKVILKKNLEKLNR